MRRLIKELALVLIIAIISGWFSFAYTYLNDMNWHKDTCTCGGKLTYEHEIGGPIRLYECEDCGRNFRLVNKYER